MSRAHRYQAVSSNIPLNYSRYTLNSNYLAKGNLADEIKKLKNQRIAAIYQNCLTTEEIEEEFECLRTEMDSHINATMEDTRQKLLETRARLEEAQPANDKIQN